MESNELANFFNHEISELVREKNELLPHSQVLKKTLESLETEILVLCEQKEKALRYVDGLKVIIGDNPELLEIITEELEKHRTDILDAFE